MHNVIGKRGGSWFCSYNSCLSSLSCCIGASFSLMLGQDSTTVHVRITDGGSPYSLIAISQCLMLVVNSFLLVCDIKFIDLLNYELHRIAIPVWLASLPQWVSLILEPHDSVWASLWWAGLPYSTYVITAIASVFTEPMTALSLKCALFVRFADFCMLSQSFPPCFLCSRRGFEATRLKHASFWINEERQKSSAASRHS